MTNDTFTSLVSQAAASFPNLASRIDAAADIAKGHLQNPRAGIIRATIKADGQVVYTVQGSTAYTVTATTCTCPDYAHRHTACKHLMAVRLVEQAMGREHNAPVSAPTFTRESENAAERQARRVARREWVEEV